MRQGIGLATKVLPSTGEGAILEISFGTNIPNKDEFDPPKKTINEALSSIPQRAFGGNLDSFKFGGTNVIMEDGRIILIKGENDESQWNDAAAQADVNRILPPNLGGQK